MSESNAVPDGPEPNPLTLRKTPSALPSVPEKYLASAEEAYGLAPGQLADVNTASIAPISQPPIAIVHPRTSGELQAPAPALTAPLKQMRPLKFHMIMLSIFLLLTVGATVVGLILSFTLSDSQIGAAVAGSSWLLAMLQIPVWLIWSLFRWGARRRHRLAQGNVRAHV